MIDAWEWPQWTIIAIYTLTLLIHAASHGETRTSKHNFPLAICCVAICVFILYMGGFWT